MKKISQDIGMLRHENDRLRATIAELVAERNSLIADKAEMYAALLAIHKDAEFITGQRAAGVHPRLRDVCQISEYALGQARAAIAKANRMDK